MSYTCGHCHNSHEYASTAFLCARTEGVVTGSPEDYRRTPEEITYILTGDRPSWDAPVRTPVTEDGMYQTKDGSIFKVQVAVNGSGRLYAKKLVPNDDPAVNDWRFEYAPGALKLLCAEDRLTLDKAKKFGKMYGVCCNCGRTLTDETSIAEGIGPICAGRI